MYLAVHEDGVGGHYCYFLQVTPQAGPTESFNLHEGLDQVHIGCHDQLHLPWGGLVKKRSRTARCNYYKTNQAEVRKDMLDDFLSLAGELQVILTSNQSVSRGVQLFSINGVSDHPSMCCGPNCVQPPLCFNLMIPFS